MVKKIEYQPKKETAIVTSNIWRIILLIVVGYEAAGGLTGGVLLSMAPDGHLMEMPIDIMHGVFPDFLIPGVILIGLGVLNALAFISILRKKENDWFMAGLAMGGYYIWFIVEIIILRELHWLHLMWGLPILVGWMVTIPLIYSRNKTETMKKALLYCGALSSVWYIAINVVVPFYYEGYSFAGLTVSELSALGAPTRILWVLSVSLYPLLFAAFGWGVLDVANGNRALKAVGILTLAYCAFNLYWPPMHMRGSVPTLTDTLHIVWASITVLMMMILMVFGAIARESRFRPYTILSLIALIFFGVLTFLESPNIPTNGPTPTIGIWERINIGIFMIWVIVLSIDVTSKNHVQQVTG